MIDLENNSLSVTVDEVQSAGTSASIARAMRDRVLRAGLWSTTLRGGLRTVGFVRNVLIARILAPADLGLFGIALVILSILDRFTNTGLQAALIQRKEHIEDYLDTAWTMQAVRGLALGAAVYLAAGNCASFFNEPQAAPILRVLAFVLVLRGIASPGVLVLIRELDFKADFLRRFAGNVVELVVSLATAVFLRNAWALMAGLVAGNLTIVIVSFMIHPFRPSFRFGMAQARQLLRYGRWIFLNEVLYFLSYRGDNLIVGKFLGPPTLGLYMIAYSISDVITVEVSRLVNDVAFPAYSRLQLELAKVRAAFILSSQLVICIAVPMAVITGLMAAPMMALLFDTEWSQAATALPFLAMAGAIRAGVANASAVYRALGRPDLAFRSSLIRVGAMYILMYPLLNAYGLLGVSLAVLGGMIAVIPEFFVVTRQVLSLTARDFATMALPGIALGAGVGSAVAIWLGARGAPSWYEVPAVLVVIVSSYAAVAYVLWRLTGTGPLLLLRWITGSMRSVRMSAAAEPRQT